MPSISLDYVFHNDTTEPRDVAFRLKFPADKAIYDALQMTINDQAVSTYTDSDGTVGGAPLYRLNQM